VRTHLDLFSGIGGFALAANWAGFTTVGFVENENYPRRILGKQFPGIPIHSDIHDFDATPFRGVDLITGGFPCQPFSAAGKQRGKEDDRWLWKEMLRVIVEAQPTWVLVENVAGIINMALDEVLADLEAQDYATATVILPACAVDASHRRDRVWIIARNVADTDSDRREQVSDRKSGQAGGDRQQIHEQERQPGCPQSASVFNADSIRCEGCAEKQVSGQRKKPREFVRTGKANAKLWPAEPSVGRVANGIPKRVDRLKGLGNAIVPQVAYEIIRHFD
jgi:DNA (cytosine-5)-methyltransferase 1